MSERKALERAKRASGLNVSDLARRLGVSRVTLSRWLHGHQTPDVRTWREVRGRLDRLLKHTAKGRKTGRKGR